MRLFCLFLLLLPMHLFANSLKLKLLDEYIIPANAEIQKHRIGGLSSIDFSGSGYVFIADDSKQPRFFTAQIDIRDNRFSQVQFDAVTLLKDEKELPFADNQVDPEGLRVLNNNMGMVWISEGLINRQVPPAIFIQSANKTVRLPLPSMFEPAPNSGPRHNAVFEGISKSHDGQGIWVSMEGSLQQDGEEANMTHGSSVRVSHYDLANGKLGQQFVYPLDPIVKREDAPANAFRTTGLVELLQLDKNRFLTMERSFTAGVSDGGNDVKIYMVDITGATDTSKLHSLKQASFQPGRKSLLLDLASIKSKLPSKHIDNLEGMTFGPRLGNGNLSLLMVADNNFNLYQPQLNQLLLFELQLD